MDDLTSKETEMTRALGSARNWLVIVGLFQFTYTVVTLYFIEMPYGMANVTDMPYELADVIDRLLSTRARHAIYSSVLFAVFMVLWLFATRSPALYLLIAIGAFWVIQLVKDPENLAVGWGWKLLCTAALFKGIHSASRAERLSYELPMWSR